MSFFQSLEDYNLMVEFAILAGMREEAFEIAQVSNKSFNLPYFKSCLDFFFPYLSIFQVFNFILFSSFLN